MGGSMGANGRDSGHAFRSSPMHGSRTEWATPPSTMRRWRVERIVVLLRAQVAQFQGTCARARALDREREGEASSITMPVLVPAELTTWMEERQADRQSRRSDDEGGGRQTFGRDDGFSVKASS